MFRLYDCALAVKAGASATEIRFYEKKLSVGLHRDCARLNDIAVHHDFARECDACD
jgi:hypothetical protein